ncbi:HGH1 protein [Plectosphaerella cucumerina]|uniref:Protein HGH1 homolog n=1 Tax=Plectosphaerella cucumerina TaxID=40658 RepID=A0A8K0X112_9PEZI|nr:HGH1 protein [Plectosphaerella cucumerina]
MPTELEELVGFIASPNPQIRMLAAEGLIPYSVSQPAIFKTENLLPVKNLTLLTQDHPKIAEHALTILVNLTGEQDVVELLAANDKFVDSLLAKIVKPDEPNANLMAMLLANLAKHDGIKKILDKKQPPPEALHSNDLVINQLLDLFVKGAEGSYNKSADYDYLSYLFADLAKHDEIRAFLLRKQSYDDAVPLTKLRVFTEHSSDIRRKGVASTIKNAAFEVASHPDFFAEDEINILPYLLLPIMGDEEYDADETMDMLPDLQLLPPDKKREPDATIVQTHLETLMLLTTTREGRELLRKIQVYPIVRETHGRVADEDVREACDRLVQVLMRDEEDAVPEGAAAESRVKEVDDEDDQLVEV